ncbi:hypothetical protein CL614_05030 [archaeon]|nr:hypothetical protein [archaeon]|tara:strand:+ start:487 stop:864 length:378 start_codon:yes stop_codon:yes gene_type:complete
MTTGTGFLMSGDQNGVVACREVGCLNLIFPNSEHFSDEYERRVECCRDYIAVSHEHVKGTADRRVVSSFKSALYRLEFNEEDEIVDIREVNRIEYPIHVQEPEDMTVFANVPKTPPAHERAAAGN